MGRRISDAAKLPRGHPGTRSFPGWKRRRTRSDGPDITIKHIPGRYVATLKNGLSPAKMRLAHCVVVAFYILARDLLKEGQTQAIQLHSAEDPNAGPLSPYHVEMCLRHALRLLVPPARIRRLIAEAGPGEDLVSRAAETFGITRAAARIFLSRHGADAVAEETMPA